MELTKIRNLSDEELKSEQAKAAEQLFRIRFQKSLGNTEGIKKLRVLKLDIARIQTVARERTLASAAPAQAAAAAPARSSRKKAKKD
ncbi:MAG: 50S ribosomal protein L29 [Acidobacteriota bacterium]|nr:50S ribosomal protein L29 [Acidobacteriota bacterium]